MDDVALWLVAGLPDEDHEDQGETPEEEGSKAESKIQPRLGAPVGSSAILRLHGGARGVLWPSVTTAEGIIPGGGGRGAVFRKRQRAAEECAHGGAGVCAGAIASLA
ncbi:hypothetical protein Vafri_9116 [Volvox africanus]|uniref:Uncharacterized protein n=1 Tax=Volvox africanus TaxID=51714 RepID=A0A8J4EYN3_9CHLO|nr:hypothetical protein Vafri_9116 [Volvox africanus]